MRSITITQSPLPISFTLSTPVGATVVAVDLALFLLSCLLRALAVRR